MSNLGDYAYFVLIYNYLQTEIANFQNNVVANMMSWAAGIAVVLVTLWIMIQGYRIATGQSREPMMALVVNGARIALIVTAATSMAVFGTGLESFLSANGGLASEISTLVAGNGSPVSAIDENMAATQLTMAAIDVVQVAPGDTESANKKAHDQLLATFGAASPAMAAGAMLLLYQFAMAIFVGFGPIFILCLIFEQTKSMFHRWLFYGISTLFAIALLDAVSSIVLKLTENVAAALWGANVINSLLGTQAEGFDSQAMQQGGIGLLMTVLIISVPPMAGQFFGGTVGNFMYQSAFGFGGRAAAMQRGMQTGVYGGGGGGYASSAGAIGQQGNNTSGGDALGGPGPGFNRLLGPSASAAQNAGPTLSPGYYGKANQD